LLRSSSPIFGPTASTRRSCTFEPGSIVSSCFFMSDERVPFSVWLRRRTRNSVPSPDAWISAPR
jgi:hypothetical protein